ncbi:glycosyltransferase [Herbiconiux sp. VKM Ac-1786]|uniref:glycosyltransferase n=1 Tax=Herbiconiux sp. VKM Ac-1786 TaxID=2783824 RepID=UPI00188CFE16|nr:nucleotide disphospho-sugar-binding domain-containing protein [Herbiconiux sp. VKM Ac-1786]MBF4572540.1 glycosyltransferase [Herbiconiux sp. VKM Ac-1786]
MTLLIISPDYASHLLPLATLGTAWQAAGERVVVATGPATDAIVRSFGFERVELQLGKGSNPGVIRAEEQPAGEDDALRGFFDATRRGMVAALSFQASARLSDLMWEPVRTARRVQEVVAAVAPDRILVDHLAFSARLALVAAGIPHVDVVLGHPSALPVPGSGEVYGFPPAWPSVFSSSLLSSELQDLRALCEQVDANFTAEWNAALRELNPSAPPASSAFEEHGQTLLFNYPVELADAGRRALYPASSFIGSSVRSEDADEVRAVEAWIASSPEPIVYVSFGSFLSVRDDVLARVVSALRSLAATTPLRVALAVGSADRAVLGELPSSWLVQEFLPQVALLGAAAAAVTHGGNNSVTEAMTAGVPLLVLPFSTDQFAGAAALVDAGFARALDPNAATPSALAEALAALLPLAPEPAARLAALSASLRAAPGPARARAAASAAPPLVTPPH